MDLIAVFIYKEDIQEENEKYNPRGKQNASRIRHCTEEDYICTQKENEKLDTGGDN